MCMDQRMVNVLPYCMTNNIVEQEMRPDETMIKSRILRRNQESRVKRERASRESNQAPAR